MRSLLTRFHDWLGLDRDTTSTTFDCIAPPAYVWACMTISLFVAFLARWPRFADVDFPLNDGALFLVLIEAVIDNGFVLPHAVEFNGMSIPFAYPPLAFYVFAAISRITGLEPLSLVTYLPLLLNFVAVGLFTHLAARLSPSKSALVFAAFTFPLIPRSYEWLVMGGGVTRVTGMLFVLGALLCAARATRAMELRWLAASTAFLAGALASHLEWGITGWVSVTLLLLAARTSLATARTTFVMGCMMGVLTLPWWSVVLATHGLDPFLAASSTSGWNDVGFGTRLVYFDLFTLSGSMLGVVAAVGLVLCIIASERRLRMTAVWLFLIFLTTPRHGATVATMPVAILLGVALSRGVAQVVQWLRPWLGRDAEASAGGLRPDRLVVIVLHGAICVASVLYIQWEIDERAERNVLVPLTRDERAGMEWIRERVEPAASFLVVSSATNWESDRASEWFPVLAQHKTVNTVQGLEWIREVSFEEFSKQSDIYRQASAMSPSIAPNLGLQLYGPTHTHVAVFAEPGAPIRQSYQRSPLYEAVVELAGVAVLRLRPEIADGLQLMPGNPLSAL